MNPDLDLTIGRIIKAPLRTVWRAWTDPRRLEQWWVPKPSTCRVDRLDLTPGGALITRFSEDGEDFVPHMDACFIAVDEFERIVFTNAIDSTWRPALPAPVSCTAAITFKEHGDGTDYQILVRHGDPEARALHEKLGFAEGWGSVTTQLAEFAEGGR